MRTQIALELGGEGLLRSRFGRRAGVHWSAILEFTHRGNRVASPLIGCAVAEEFAVQILSSEVHLDNDNSKFKGVTGVEEEIDNGLHKYKYRYQRSGNLV